MVSDGKELKPEPLGSGGENALQLVQGINLEKRLGRSIAPGRDASLRATGPDRATGRRRCEYDRLPRLDIVRSLATPRLTVTTRPRISRLRHNPIRPGRDSLDQFGLKRQSAEESSSTTAEFKTGLIGPCLKRLEMRRA